MRYKFLCLILMMPVSCLAEMYDTEYQQCNQNSTLGIVDCVHSLTKQWDKRLNSAYKEVLKRSEAPQQAQLKTAQRLWIKYRDANCGFYGAGPGTISRIEAVECLRSMTRDRTCELKAMTQQESGPGPECKVPPS